MPEAEKKGHSRLIDLKTFAVFQTPVETHFHGQCIRSINMTFEKNAYFSDIKVVDSFTNQLLRHVTLEDLR